MVDIRNVSFEYKVTLADGSSADNRGITNLNLHVKKGEVIVLTGGSGCGKTTVVRLINGLIPNYYEGSLSGDVIVGQKNVKDTPIYEISEMVGSVFQNPRSQFFNVNSTDEIAFAAENQRRDPEVIKSRIKDTAATMNIEKLLNRSLFELSGGEKQIVACAGIEVLSPEVIVLDEPSSNLDHQAIKRLASVMRRWKDEGKTIVVAEHRLFYLRELADRMIVMESGQIKKEFSRKELEKLKFRDTEKLGIRALSLDDIIYDRSSHEVIEEEKNLITLENFDFSYKDSKHGIHIDSIAVPSNKIIAIIGHNGAGKSTLARNICGLEKRCKGSRTFNGKKLGYKERLGNSYMIMQDVNHQLFTESVEDEVMLSMTEKKVSGIEKQKNAGDILSRLDLKNVSEAHPMSLSGGQKQRTAIASGIASNKPIIVLDEPTSGLDLMHMKQVSEEIKSLKKIGKSIFVVTHDMEFIIHCSDYILRMEEGKIRDFYRLDGSSISKLIEFINED